MCFNNYKVCSTLQKKNYFNFRTHLVTCMLVQSLLLQVGVSFVCDQCSGLVLTALCAILVAYVCEFSRTSRGQLIFY